MVREEDDDGSKDHVLVEVPLPVKDEELDHLSYWYCLVQRQDLSNVSPREIYGTANIY